MEGQKTFECHFTFLTNIETYGHDKDGVIENIEEKITDSVVQQVEEIFGCGLWYDPDEKKIKKLENGWWNCPLLWSGFWIIMSETKEEAERIAKQLLHEYTLELYVVFTRMLHKYNRFFFTTIQEQKITDVIPY